MATQKVNRELAQEMIYALRDRLQWMKQVNIYIRGAMRECVGTEMKIAYVRCRAKEDGIEIPKDSPMFCLISITTMR